MLRNYGGLFADYGYIDESMVAQQAGISQPQCYEILKALSQRQLISFIPQKKVPYIRYMQRREDKEHVILPRSIYEERRKQYELRIKAMLQYAETSHRCRSRMLLEYFGEKSAKNCGQCDFCLEEHGETVTKKGQENARQQILSLLADRQRHHITELFRLQLPTDELNAALSYLVEEEKIKQEDGFLTL